MSHFLSQPNLQQPKGIKRESEKYASKYQKQEKPMGQI
jgi:hypothetical protein